MVIFLTTIFEENSLSIVFCSEGLFGGNFASTVKDFMQDLNGPSREFMSGYF